MGILELLRNECRAHVLLDIAVTNCWVPKLKDIRVDQGNNASYFDRHLPWSELDLNDLLLQLNSGAGIVEAADFLCRSIDEVRAEADELGLSKAIALAKH
jgi:hypothetical protein